MITAEKKRDISMQLVYLTWVTRASHRLCKNSDYSATKTAVFSYAAYVALQCRCHLSTTTVNKKAFRTYNLFHTAQRHSLQYLEHTDPFIVSPDNAGLSADTATVTAAESLAKVSHVLLHVDRSWSLRASEIFHFLFAASRWVILVVLVNQK